MRPPRIPAGAPWALVVVVSLVACRRDRARSTRGDASVAAAPPAYALEVKELPPIDLGPARGAWSTRPYDREFQVQPTRDGGLVAFEPWWRSWDDRDRPDEGRIEMWKFDDAGHERWSLTVRAEPDVAQIFGGNMVVAGDSIWVLIDGTGRIELDGRSIDIGEGDATAVSLLRFSSATGAVLGHRTFSATEGVGGGPMIALDEGILIFVKATSATGESEWYTPGYEGHLVRIDGAGLTLWTLGVDQWSDGALLVADESQIAIADDKSIPHRIGGREVPDIEQWDGWHAFISHDGHLTGVGPLELPAGSLGSFVLSQGRPFYTASAVATANGRPDGDGMRSYDPPIGLYDPYVDYDGGKFDIVIPPGPRQASALIIETAAGRRRTILRHDDACASPAILPVFDGMFFLCAGRIELRDALGEVLSRTPISLTGDTVWTFGMRDHIILVTRTWTGPDQRRMRVFKISMLPRTGPTPRQGAP